MIKFGPYHYLTWQAVKAAWKDGRRGTLTGVPSLPCYDYAVGDNFLLYPNASQRPEGDVCSLTRDGVYHDITSGSSVHSGSRYCGTLSPY